MQHDLFYQVSFIFVLVCFYLAMYVEGWLLLLRFSHKHDMMYGRGLNHSFGPSPGTITEAILVACVYAWKGAKFEPKLNLNAIQRLISYFK